MPPEMLGQMVVNGIVLAVVYVLLGLGLTMLYSMMGILWFASGQMYMLAAFAIYFFYKRTY